MPPRRALNAPIRRHSGHYFHYRLVLRVFDESPRHPLQDRRLGTRPANRLRVSGDALVRTASCVFSKLGAGANWLLDFAYYGSSFVFGDLGQKNSPRGFYFAFQALPTIIFIAAFFALLYYSASCR